MRVLELFSGIGGLHWALKMTGIDFEVVAAVEINTTVCETYAHNFPDVRLWNRNIESLTAKEINKLSIDAILMSPPCQPFCRTGLGEGSKDSRSSPLNHLLEILPCINFKYIFVENVQGFETSDAHKQLLATLADKCDFSYVEFLLTPSSFSIPNSRLRYYLIGKHKSIPWWSTDKASDGILRDIPQAASLTNFIYSRVVEAMEKRWSSYTTSKRSSNNAGNDCNSMREILRHERVVNDVLENSAEISGYLVPSRIIVKYINAVDIVRPQANQSCCFTKAYSHYLTGTGSLLDIGLGLDVNDIKAEDRKLRYFTPKEIARLMCYPEEFTFPSNQTKKQRYRALGNSVNVYVVAVVLSFLLDDNAVSIHTGL